MDLPLEIVIRLLEDFPQQLRCLDTRLYEIHNELCRDLTMSKFDTLDDKTKVLLKRYIQGLDVWRGCSRTRLKNMCLGPGFKEFVDDSWYILYNILVKSKTRPINYLSYNMGHIKLKPNILAKSVSVVEPGRYSLQLFIDIRHISQIRYIPLVCTTINRTYTFSATTNIHEIICSQYREDMEGLYCIRLGNFRVHKREVLDIESFLEENHPLFSEARKIMILGYQIKEAKHTDEWLLYKLYEENAQPVFNFPEQQFLLSWAKNETYSSDMLAIFDDFDTVLLDIEHRNTLPLSDVKMNIQRSREYTSRYPN
ncbi:hypothetical protein RNJ44_04004 [Nakaseomyces bracarensis]|uniref:F-box domain-containing protein n=1 Tax=Nakaseomyces bracarensis TaxID=273131 RepID=A0ABR4NTV8_9SACH